MEYNKNISEPFEVSKPQQMEEGCAQENDGKIKKDPSKIAIKVLAASEESENEAAKSNR